jgi:hypothetical protein
MHNPGICGVILPSGAGEASSGEGGAAARSRAEILGALIASLDAGSDLVLVVLGAGAETLAPVAWAQAAYVLQLPSECSRADALRAALRDVLNRGRDTALVVSLSDAPLSAERVQSMVEAYREADDNVWAVVDGAEIGHGQPMLLGRIMIEALLRNGGWESAEDVLAANLPHVRLLAAAEPSA